MASLPLVGLGINTEELIRAMTALSRTGITASQAAVRLRESMARLHTLPVHYNTKITQTICPICELEEKAKTPELVRLIRED